MSCARLGTTSFRLLTTSSLAWQWEKLSVVLEVGPSFSRDETVGGVGMGHFIPGSIIVMSMLLLADQSLGWPVAPETSSREGSDCKRQQLNRATRLEQGRVLDFL